MSLSVRGHYTAIIDAFQPGVPVFVRWTWQEKTVKPVYLKSNSSTGYYEPLNRHEPIQLSNWKCFERLIRAKCMYCFYPGLSPFTVERFKQVAYRQLKNQLVLDEVSKGFVGGPIIVTLAHRGYEAGRHMGNIQVFLRKNTSCQC